MPFAKQHIGINYSLSKSEELDLMFVLFLISIHA